MGSTSSDSALPDHRHHPQEEVVMTVIREREVLRFTVEVDYSRGATL